MKLGSLCTNVDAINNKSSFVGVARTCASEAGRSASYERLGLLEPSYFCLLTTKVAEDIQASDRQLKNTSSFGVLVLAVIRYQGP
jgi:hypothetical protein